MPNGFVIWGKPLTLRKAFVTFAPQHTGGYKKRLTWEDPVDQSVRLGMSITHNMPDKMKNISA